MSFLRRGPVPKAAALLTSWLVAGVVGACAPDSDSEDPSARSGGDVEGRLGALLDRTMDEIRTRADSVDARLHPVPLLRPEEQSSLRSYLNEAHLGRARSLGARPAMEDDIQRLVDEGRLEALADTTPYWVVRELDFSMPYVTPDTRALLERAGERFHERLDSLGVPRYRFEVTSVLRTAEQQAALRGANANATGGASAHEFGTTVDLAYSAFAAPAEPLVVPDVQDAPWLESRLRRVADGVAELVAARRSRELQAVLGRVLREMQSEGLVYVTMERQQPVYHITVARRLADQPATAQ